MALSPPFENSDLVGKLQLLALALRESNGKTLAVNEFANS